MEYTATKKDAITNTNEGASMNEDATTKAIEQQTKKIPSDVFLVTAIGAMAMSLTLKLFGRKKDAMFVGQWVAPILIVGVYNKLVKQEDTKNELHRN